MQGAISYSLYTKTAINTVAVPRIAAAARIAAAVHIAAAVADRIVACC